MASPQVGIYTSICLVAIKLTLIVLEALLYYRLSTKVRKLHQRVVDNPTHPYNRCFRQLKRIQLDLEELEQLRNRGPPAAGAGLDHPAVNEGVPPSPNITELAQSISASIQHRRYKLASDDLNKLSDWLWKSARYINRDLTSSNETILLDYNMIQKMKEDIKSLHTYLGPCKISVPARFLLTSIKKKQRRNARILRILGVVMGAISIILGGATFVGARGVRLNEEHQCWIADADIIGDGVRAGAWSQSAMLFLTTFLGVFHHSHTAVKEVGSGLIGMHVSLALAFIGPLAQGELSPVDAILGSMVLDVQNSALSMQLMEKETLAARWQVGAVAVAQLLGLVTIGILIHGFTNDRLAVDSCKCFSVFWWSWFSNCPTEHSNQVFPFWIYYSLRCLSTAHSWHLALSKTKSYDKALKWENTNLSRLCETCMMRNHSKENRCNCNACTEITWTCKNCARQDCCLKRRVLCEPCPDCEKCENCSHVSFEFSEEYVKLGSRMHSELPTTVSQLYLEHAAFVFLSMAAAERTITTQSVRLTSPVYSIGQITPIVIAGLTILRVGWVTVQELFQQNRKKS